MGLGHPYIQSATMLCDILLLLSTLKALLQNEIG